MNKRLWGLELENAFINCDGAVALAEGLKHNRALRVLSLRSNEIGDRGAAALAEVTYLPCLTLLGRLD